MKIPRFEEEEGDRIQEIRNRKPEREVVKYLCCERFFSSIDKRRIRFCPSCKVHASTAGALGCPIQLAEFGGLNLREFKVRGTFPFNAHPRPRRRHEEEIPEEEEFDLFEEDLGVKVRMDRDE